jgi:C_GCAxxG_C_C family probable redox protein
MKLREDKAIEPFRAGLNCAQAVLGAYSEDLNFDKNLALNISCGFGGGMGRLQETCGAVTGSYMVLSIFNGNKYQDNKVKKEKSYSMIQEFDKKFRELNGSTICKTLLKCEIKTEAGHTFAKENHLFETVCEKCITDSLLIIKELIDK